MMEISIIERCCECQRPIHDPTTYLDGFPCHYECARAVVAQQSGPAQRNRSSTALILTAEQQAAREAIDKAVAQRQHFAVHGLAGTGKTTLAAHVASSLPDDAFLCAPTAKATAVLTQKTGIGASTIHSAFYHFVKEIEREDQPPRLVFRPAHGPGSLRGKVLLLDEVSMVARDVAADIIATGITIIAFGDPGQLPPIEGLPFSISADFILTQIHRQALESPMIRQAHAVRSTGCYAADGDAVRVIESPADDDLRAADVVLTGRRATRMRMNAEIRRALGMTSPLPRYGEPLVCLRNARKYGLCNGGIYYASRDLYPDDETVGISSDAGDIEVHGEFLTPGHEYDKLELRPGGWMTGFAFGYALTVHQAQGSEWDKVLLIDESAAFRDDRARWLYTAVTRAKERIVIARPSASPWVPTVP
jgi:exodeoxyribonuclease-5